MRYFIFCNIYHTKANMMNTTPYLSRSVIAVLVLLGALPLAAANGTWTSATGGTWSDTTNWASGTIADGADGTAAFAPAAELSVTVDTVRTIGAISHGGPARLNLQAPASGPLTLQTTTAAPLIQNAALQFMLMPLAGTQGFIKKGAGRLVLQNQVTHALSGPLCVEQGELRLDNAAPAVPSVALVVVTNADSAVRLHVVSPGDTNATDVYAGPFRLSGYFGLASGPMASMGPLFVYADGLNAAVSNIVLTKEVATFTTIGQLGVGGGLELRGEISGDCPPKFMVKAGAKTFDFIGSNTYAAETTLEVAAGVGTFNFRGPQRIPHGGVFPQAVFLSVAATGATAVLDIHNHDMRLGYTAINGPGIHYLRSTGGGNYGGVITIDNPNPANDYGLVMSEGGTLVLESGTLFSPTDHAAIRDNCELLVSGGYFNCGLEILLGHGGSATGTGIVTVANAGVVRNFVCRNGDTGFGPGLVNLDPGGRFETAAMRTTANVPYGMVSCNGGILSDGAYDDWNGSYADWIMTNITVLVKAGGAHIEVNNASGRALLRMLEHDPALGGAPDGGLVKYGPGHLTLGASNTYTGPTIINSGMVYFTAAGSLPDRSMLLQLAGGACDLSGLAGGTLVLANGRTLAGNGVLGGNLDLANGVVTPGPGIAALSITGAATLQPGALYQWDIGAAGSADALIIDGALTLPAAVNVVTVQVGIASAPDESNTYVICSAFGGINGSADSIFMHYGATGMVGPEHPLIVGTDVVVALAVPEPGAVLLGVAALVCLHRRRPCRSGHFLVVFAR